MKNRSANFEKILKLSPISRYSRSRPCKADFQTGLGGGASTLPPTGVLWKEIPMMKISSQRAIAKQLAACKRFDLHPTNHPEGCRCVHCWEEETFSRTFLDFECEIGTDIL